MLWECIPIGVELSGRLRPKAAQEPFVKCPVTSRILSRSGLLNFQDPVKLDMEW